MTFPTVDRGSAVTAQMFFVFLSILICLGSATNVSYATPPPINFTQLVQLNKSSQQSVFIGSKRMESLEITQNGGSTTFKLTYFNRSAPNNINQYRIADEAGTWTYLKGTQETLSCSLIYDTTNSVFGLLFFQNDLGIFSITARMDLTTLRTYLPVPFQALNYTLLAAGFVPGENCKAGFLFNSVYYLPSPTEVSAVLLPTGWQVSSYTESFEFGITNNKLYKLNPDTYQYDSIYTFQTFQTYRIKEYEGRMIISAANGTSNSSNSSNSSGLNHFIQKIFFFKYTASGLVLIKTISLNGSADAQGIIPIFTSPQLTKMGYSYVPAGSNATSQIFPKSVDYMNNQVIDMLFSDPTHVYHTFNGVYNNAFDFSDYFLVVRNGSANFSAGAVEEAYQFMGNKVVHFASRSLNNTMELSDWQRVYVDLYYSESLVALNVYRTLDNGRVVYQVQYGNYGDTKRVIPPVTPPFIQFVEPENTFKQPVNPKNFTWGYHDTSAGTSSNVTVLRVNPYSPIHVDIYNNVVPGNLQYIARSTNCRILFEAITQAYYLFKYNASDVNHTVPYPLADDIAGLTIAPSDKWYVSEKCDKFAVKNRLYYFSGSQFDSVANDLASFDWKAVDVNMDYLVNAGNVWKYNPSQHSYLQYSTGTGILVKSAIYSSHNIVLITATNSTSSPIDAQVLAFIDENSALTPIFNYRKVFTTVPTFDFSEKLTKVVISGSIDTTATVDAFFIDYAKRTNISIIFPMSTVRDIGKTSIGIFEEYIYVRQIYDPSQSSNTSYTSVNQKQFAYYLKDSYLPQLLLERNLTVQQAGTWVKSLIVSDDGVDFHIATESLETIQSKPNVVVRLTELDPKQAQLANGNNQAISGYVINNTIVLCNPGCSDCSTQICTGCKTGFAFKASSALCIPCPPGCSSCDSTDPSKCSGCLNGTYLSGTSCLPCAASCITCTGSASSCLTCTAGQFYSSGAGQCMLCPRNCLTCSGAATCTQCNKGFVVTPAGSCRGCAISCSDCLPGDITLCTACGKGLQLSGGQCIQCPSNCLECNNGNCQTCVPGYGPNSAGTCVPNCRLPCATCVDNQPTVCTSCYNSAALSNGNCEISLSCNSTGTCTDCGQGLGYFLLERYCYPCSQITTIPNCIQCSQTNQFSCSICKDGFYLDAARACPACPSSCITCVGSTLCTSCQSGFTLPADQTQGPCLQCQSPCASCFGTPRYCTTCVEGFTKNGWKCLNDTRISFTITLTGGNQATVLGSIDVIIAALLSMMGESTSNVDAITIQSVVAASVVLVASASPSAGVSSATSLAAGLSAGPTWGSLTVSSSSVTVTSPQSSGKPAPNVGLIVGLVIGLTVFAAIIVTAVCIYKAKLKTKSETIADSSFVEMGKVANQVAQTNSGASKLEKEDFRIDNSEEALEK